LVIAGLSPGLHSASELSMAYLPACSRLDNDFATADTAIPGVQASSSTATAIGAVLPVVTDAVSAAARAITERKFTHKVQSDAEMLA